MVRYDTWPAARHGGTTGSHLRLAIVALSLITIGGILALHYGAPLRALGVHDLLRRLFYLPVAAAAIAGGFRLGLLAAAVAALGYGPHVIELVGAGVRVGDQVMEMLVLGGVGALVGVYADSSRRARALAAERSRVGALAEVGITVMEQVEGPLRSIEGQAESLLFASGKSGGPATAFAVWAIRSEAVRIRRLLHDLKELGRAGARTPTRVDLGSLVRGITADVSAARPSRTPLLMVEANAPAEVQAERAALAYALRVLLLSLWDAVPPPAWIAVGIETGVLSAPALRIQVRTGSDWMPDLRRVVTGVFGAGVADYRFHQALGVHLLKAQGVRTTFQRISDTESCLRLDFSNVPKAVCPVPASTPGGFVHA